jgi:hypothetical protein
VSQQQTDDRPSGGRTRTRSRSDSAQQIVVVFYSISLTEAMTYMLFYPLFRLVFGTLYPAYASYKAVRTKNVKEYVSRVSACSSLSCLQQQLRLEICSDSSDN